jgi:hypothetical protein
MLRIACALLLALTGAGQDTVHIRPGIVASPDGAPVALEGSETIDGRVHGRATLRNESEAPLTRVVFAVTLGGEKGQALRRTQVVPVSIEPGAEVQIPLRGIRPAAVARLLPDVAAPVAELAIVGVEFADGTRWRARSAAGWLGRPGLGRLTFRCVDDTDTIRAVGDAIVQAGEMKRCQADGTFGPGER